MKIIFFYLNYKDESINKNEHFEKRNPGAEIQKAALVRFTKKNLSFEKIEEEFCFECESGYY